MNPDDELLASAYLDGELTDDERRRAEASSAVMAEVEELRVLRAALADVEPPSATAREAAIAAAMGEFAQLREGVERTADAEVPAAAAADVARVVPLRRRPRSATWLGVAAAVVAIGLVGVVVANGRRGGDEPSAGDVAPISSERGGSRLTESALDTTAAATNDTAAATLDDTAEMDALAPDDSTDVFAASEADTAIAGGADVAGDAGGSADSTEIAIDPALFFTLPGQPNADGTRLPITTPAELSAAVGYLLDLAEQGELGPTPETRCPYPVLAEAVAQTGPTAADIDEVYVAALDEEAIAIDRTSCDVMLAADLGR